MPQSRALSSRFGDPESEGTDMEIINANEGGKDVTKEHVSCPIITETQQMHMELSKETNKEGEVKARKCVENTRAV